MSAGDEWANDAPSKPGCPLLPAASLLALALVAILALALVGCRPPSVEAPVTGSQPTVATPVTGPQPQPPATPRPAAVTAVVPSAVQVRP
ncbi:hypothetical protein [Lentzea sp. NPDC059081]|uniref:hypothetical protein n=1 Tax=Lentzea sp. NPDC059081 TaxID=3346719 RepID=UPI00368259B8